MTYNCGKGLITGWTVSPCERRRLRTSPMTFIKTLRHSRCRITPQERISSYHVRLWEVPVAIPILNLLSPPSHGVYKWQQATPPRSVSFAGSTGQTPDPVFEHIHKPGGFRRNSVLLQGATDEEGEPPRILNNFIDFLYIFGHFVSDPLSLHSLCFLLTSVRQEKTLRRSLPDPRKSATEEDSGAE